MFMGFAIILALSAAVNGMVTYKAFAEIDSSKSTFIIIGDTQRTSAWEFWRERNFFQTQSLAAEMARRDPAFIIHLGDLTARGSSTRHWNLFEKYHKPIFDRGIPIFPILGNHDYLVGRKRALNNFFVRFPYLESKRWYSFTFKRVGFLMLDSNFKRLTADEMKQQNDWYRAELVHMEESADIDFIIVCAHHPPYTNSKTIKPSERVRIDFAEPFQRRRKTAIFFSGHCHSYERFSVGGKYFIVSGGGGGPRHKLAIDERERKFADQFNGAAMRFFHFCEIEMHDGRLDFKVVKLNADDSFSEIDRLRIETETHQNP
jgi:predicted phosphodiesterase